MRLGLSDSMRSTVAMEDTEPLYTATHRRTPPQTEIPPAQPQTKPRAKDHYHASRRLVVVLIGAAVLYVAIWSLGLSLRTRNSANLPQDKQFEHLQRSLEMLGRDTAELQMSASSFLQSCQSVQVAASTRTEMLATSVKRSFDEQVQAHVAEHEEVMKQVMEHYAKQEQQIQKARARLLELNVSLPVEITARPVSEAQYEGKTASVKQVDSSFDRFANAMTELSLVAEETLLQEGRPVSVETVTIQTTNSEKLSTPAERSSSTRSYGPFVFYAVVAGVSFSYLWSAVTDTRRKELHDTWSWSPVPSIFIRLKAFVSSVVIIEDLRERGATSNPDEGPAIPFEHIDC